MTSMTRYTLTASSLILDSEPGTSGDAAWALRGTGTRMSCPRHVRNPVTSLCTRYLPFQTGARFSAKARAPSRASSEVKTGCMSRAAWSHRPAAGQSPPCWAISLVAMSASGPLAAIFSASSSAAASAWPSSTTRLTRPISAARRASIRSPVSSSSSARARGIRWASSSAPPAPATSERLTSGTPNRAEAPATTRSQASSSSNPPASAQPSAAPISGLRGGVCVMPHSPRPGKEGDSPFRNALRSIPEENVPPAPLSTPARSSSSASSSSAASRIPAATAPFRALRASGRLMMMTCTAPRRSTCTSSLIASVPPRLLDQPLALSGQGGELTEVPAGDLGRRDAQPGVPAVVRHVRGPEVFSGHEPLGFGELGGLGVCVAGPRDGADDGGLALDLDAVQLGVVLAPVDHSRHPGIALQVGPALAAGQRVDPQGAAGPGEPDRRDVRPVRPERRQPAGPLLAEERIHFPGTHRDHPAAPLLSHPHSSLRGLVETIMADEEPHRRVIWGHYGRPPATTGRAARRAQPAGLLVAPRRGASGHPFGVPGPGDPGPAGRLGPAARGDGPGQPGGHQDAAEGGGPAGPDHAATVGRRSRLRPGLPPAPGRAARSWHAAPAAGSGLGHPAVAAGHLARPVGGGVRRGPGRE